MSARYSIGYTSTDDARRRRVAPVEIRLKRPDLKDAKVRTRAGYFAPLP